MLKKIITYLFFFFSVSVFAQEQKKEMEVPKGSKSAKATKKRTEERKEVGMKEYQAAVKKLQKAQSKETKKMQKQTKKKSKRINDKRPDNFFEKISRKKQRKK